MAPTVAFADVRITPTQGDECLHKIGVLLDDVDDPEGVAAEYGITEAQLDDLRRRIRECMASVGRKPVRLSRVEARVLHGELMNAASIASDNVDSSDADEARRWRRAAQQYRDGAARILEAFPGLETVRRH